MYRQTSPAHLTRLFGLFRLSRACGRRSCFCRCLVVGKVAPVPIVLSVPVDVVGGESVRDMSVLRAGTYVDVVAAVRVLVVHVAPAVEGCCRCLCSLFVAIFLFIVIIVVGGVGSAVQTAAVWVCV